MPPTWRISLRGPQSCMEEKTLTAIKYIVASVTLHFEVIAEMNDILSSSKS